MGERRMSDGSHKSHKESSTPNLARSNGVEGTYTKLHEEEVPNGKKEAAHDLGGFPKVEVTAPSGKKDHVEIPMDVLDDAKPDDKHGIQRSFSQVSNEAIAAAEDSKAQSNNIQRYFTDNAEATAVLVGAVDFLTQPISAFLRLSEGRMLGALTEVNLPVRFIYILMGPKTSGMDYYEIGRSISTLMANKVRILNIMS
jgi:hypothetical protein